MLYLTVRRARAARFAVVLLLSLFGQSTQANTLGVAEAQLSGAGSPCIVLAKIPLSIGFGDSTQMKSVHSADAAVRDVLRGAKSWLCSSAAVSQSLDADSLRSAIEQHQTLLFEQIRFDSRELKRADVLISDSQAAINRRYSWRVQVELVNGAWRVAQANEAPSSLFNY